MTNILGTSSLRDHRSTLRDTGGKSHLRTSPISRSSPFQQLILPPGDSIGSFELFARIGLPREASSPCSIGITLVQRGSALPILGETGSARRSAYVAGIAPTAAPQLTPSRELSPLEWALRGALHPPRALAWTPLLRRRAGGACAIASQGASACTADPGSRERSSRGLGRGGWSKHEAVARCG